LSELIRAVVVSGGIIAGSVILAFVSRWIMRTVVARVYRKTRLELDDILFKLLESPLALAIVVVGTYAAVVTLLHSDALGLSDETVGRYVDKTSRVFSAAIILVAAWAAVRIFNAFARWYATSAAPEGSAHQIHVLRKIVNIAAWALVVVLVLHQLGQKVTPLLASLGIAGLAVALALQDTLANLFSGFYLMADQSVKVGDYIKLETGEEGFVEDVGWRNTRIRLWANNMVIIPNSKLVQTVMTNYEMPQQQLSVYTWCGVSYNSDLDHVERVTIDTAKEVLERVPGSVTDFTPVVRFKEFGDSNINFVVVFRAKEVASQYMLQHEFIKALHRRYKEEGIEISWPVRVIVPSNNGKAETPV